jgi:short subunit dehydrogenase-like uncharacterized protein
VASAPIAVVGATGFTGKLVVADLHGRGVPVRVIGRNQAKCEEVARRHPGVEPSPVAWDVAAIAAALDGCGAVISCAGPFAEIGHPVAQAAVRAAVPYCDSTGEQVFIRWVFDELDAPARTAGIALVPAAGFDYVPGDLGAAIVAEGMGPLQRIDVVYGTESAATSVGTRVSSVGVMASPGVVLRDGALRPLRIGSAKRTVDLGFARMTGGAIPTGEALQVPRHVDVQTVYGYLALDGRMSPSAPGAGLFTAALKLPGAVTLMKSLARRGIEGPGERSRRKAVGCHVQAVARDGRRRAVLLEGRDPYGFTAASLAELALRLAGGADATGACAPAQVVDPRGFLAATGITVREVDPE